MPQNILEYNLDNLACCDLLPHLQFQNKAQVHKMQDYIGLLNCNLAVTDCDLPLWICASRKSLQQLCLSDSGTDTVRVLRCAVLHSAAGCHKTNPRADLQNKGLDSSICQYHMIHLYYCFGYHWVYTEISKYSQDILNKLELGIHKKQPLASIFNSNRSRYNNKPICETSDGQQGIRVTNKRPETFAFFVADHHDKFGTFYPRTSWRDHAPGCESSRLIPYN